MGMAYGVSMSTGSWVGKHNLMVMPLGDFEIILGIKEIPVCSVSSLRWSDGHEWKQCWISQRNSSIWEH